MKTNQLKFGFLLFLAIFLGLSSAIYFTINSASEKYFIEQMLHREQVIARSGAANIKSFVSLSATSLNTLSQNSDIIVPSSNTQIVLDNLVDTWKNTPLSLIARIDMQGNVVAAASNQDQITNFEAKASGREYFENGIKLKRGEYYIGNPIIPLLSGLQKKYLVPITVPVLDSHDQVVGLVVATFYISDIVNNYLLPLRISDSTDIIILDQQGVMISSLYQHLVGQNIFEFFQNNPFIGDRIIVPQIKNFLTINQEHKYDIVFPDMADLTLGRRLIATSPMILGNSQIWHLIIVTPVHDALVFVAPLVVQKITGIIFIYFATSILIIFFVKKLIK